MWGGSVVVFRCLASFLFVAIYAAGQESIQFGSLSGRVCDATGGVIENAKVTARQSATNFTAALLTDKEGRFRFAFLKAGEYEIRVQHPAFATALHSVSLGPGSAYEVPVVLAVATSEANITVSGEAAVLEAARTQVAG